MDVDSHIRLTIIGRKDGFEINGTLYRYHHIVISSSSGIIKVARKKRLHSPIELVQNHADKKNPRFLLINPLPLERYVAGIINREMISSWPIEAKKAMAVAARTYTLYKKLNSPSPYYDLSDTANDQVYGGFDAEDPEALKAVKDTAGEVMVWDNLPIEAYYHSTCGGHTVSAKDVWGKEIPYLHGKRCNYCKASPRYHWKTELGVDYVGKKLGIAKVRWKSLKIVPGKRGRSGHLIEVKIRTSRRTITMRADRFRSLLGYQKIWSTNFKVVRKGGKFIFTGKGSGHGVGLCQWGAYGMAKAGKTYHEILRYYYSGVEFRKIL